MLPEAHKIACKVILQKNVSEQLLEIYGVNLFGIQLDAVARSFFNPEVYNDGEDVNSNMHICLGESIKAATVYR